MENYLTNLPVELLREIFFHLNDYDSIVNSSDYFNRLYNDFTNILKYKLSMLNLKMFEGISYSELLNAVNVKFNNNLYYNASNYIKILNNCIEINEQLTSYINKMTDTIHKKFSNIINMTKESIENDFNTHLTVSSQDISFEYRKHHLSNLNLLINIKSMNEELLYELGRIYQDDDEDINITLHVVYKNIYILVIFLRETTELFDIKLERKELILILFNIYYGNDKAWQKAKLNFIHN